MASGFQHAGHYGSRNYDFTAPESEFSDVREYLYTSAHNTYHNLHGLYHEEGLRAAERVRDEGPEGMTLAEASKMHWDLRREEMIKSGAPCILCGFGLQAAVAGGNGGGGGGSRIFVINPRAHCDPGKDTLLTQGDFLVVIGRGDVPLFPQG